MNPQVFTLWPGKWVTHPVPWMFPQSASSAARAGLDRPVFPAGDVRGRLPDLMIHMFLMH